MPEILFQTAEVIGNANISNLSMALGQ